MSLPNIGEVIMLMGDHGSENHRQRDIRDEAERWLDSVTFPSGGDATRENKAASRAASPGSNTISITSGSQKKCNRNKTLHRRNRYVLASCSALASPHPNASQSKIVMTTSLDSNKARNKMSRRQHRRRNLALNAKEFDILLRGSIF